jgi:A/G-specific adenine glycosylase
VVSEFMLQQTQVDRVVPRFESFVRKFPTFASLADAGEDEVVEEWSGLGYYRRARMLHRLAGEVTARDGALPQTAVELERLPGVGPYTAAAVASLAFGEAVPVLDGNVCRVGARVLAMSEDPRSSVGRRRLEAWVLELLNDADPGEVNEALMELGATVCAPLEPACCRCPISSSCRANSEGRQQCFPTPRRRRATECLRWAAACVVDGHGSWLLRRIEKGPILRHLWLPPLAELIEGDDPVSAVRQLVPGVPGSAEIGPTVRHHITHRRIDVIPVYFDVAHVDPPSDAWRWVNPNDPGVPTSSLLQKLVDGWSG